VKKISSTPGDGALSVAQWMKKDARFETDDWNNF